VCELGPEPCCFPTWASDIQTRVKSHRVRAALEEAASAAERESFSAPPDEGPSTASRAWFVVGDPQTTDERFFAVLDARGLLHDDGRLRPDVGLVSIGDHFDFRAPDGSSALDVGASGLRILAWLSSHSPRQVVVLLGNHDTARVMELSRLSDETMCSARALANQIREAEQHGVDADALRRSFAAGYPDFPTPQIAWRDYTAFHSTQRKLVQRLLLSDRVCLALAAEVSGLGAVLLTHAGITHRELSILGQEGERRSERIASALNGLLRDALGRVSEAWRAGRDEPLRLEPLHVAGTTGEEGGGMLYHRPADPERAGAAEAWASRNRRRYHPKDLPAGLMQVCGHMGHPKGLEELQRWATEAARSLPFGAVRRLDVATSRDATGEARLEISYAPWAAGEPAPDGEDARRLLLIDGDMNHRDLSPSDYRLLPIERPILFR